MSERATEAGHFEVLTMGRVGVDIYPQQIGVGLAEVETFAKYLGGSATNVAVAAAQHGRAAAIITRTGDDPFGDFIHSALRELGVDDRFVSSVADLPTPVTFCEVFPPDHFPLYFYREPKAPDLVINPQELDLEAIREAEVFWVTVTGLSQEPSRTAHRVALEARARRRHTVLDLDYRPMFWGDSAEARAQVQKIIPWVTVTVGNIDECEVAVGEREPHAAAEALLAEGVELAIVKKGPDGVLARTASETVEAAPFPVDVVNGLGAGDGFGGAICHGLLAGWPLERTIRFANVAGAIVASRLSCSTAMPTSDEVTAVMEAGAIHPGPDGDS